MFMCSINALIILTLPTMTIIHTYYMNWYLSSKHYIFLRFFFLADRSPPCFIHCTNGEKIDNNPEARFRSRASVASSYNHTRTHTHMLKQNALLPKFIVIKGSRDDEEIARVDLHLTRNHVMPHSYSQRLISFVIANFVCSQYYYLNAHAICKNSVEKNGKQ